MKGITKSASDVLTVLFSFFFYEFIMFRTLRISKGIYWCLTHSQKNKSLNDFIICLWVAWSSFGMLLLKYSPNFSQSYTSVDQFRSNMKRVTIEKNVNPILEPMLSFIINLVFCARFFVKFCTHFVSSSKNIPIGQCWCENMAVMVVFFNDCHPFVHNKQWSIAIHGFLRKNVILR